MKILWLTGALLPETTAKIRNEKPQQWNTTGSWILNAAAMLSTQDDIQLFMAAPSQDVRELTRVETSRIVSYAIPYGKGPFVDCHGYDSYMQAIHDEIRPDIVHIHGTEYTHSLAYLRMWAKEQNAVISIQGMTSVLHKYYRGGITLSEILLNISFRDLIRGGILRTQLSFKKRGKYECEMLRLVSHVIGRTSWDYAHTKAINPALTYHWGGETLRKEYYAGRHWNYSECRRHSIFLSQSQYSYKGLHQLLKALPLILRQYPDTTIRVAGTDPTLGYDRSQWWRITGYGRYLMSLIKKLGVRQIIDFIGPKGPDDMIDELLQCNVFVIPSAIENSPNSLGEAQILGVPCVASYVGGVMDMMIGNEANLYRYEEVEMLAEKVCNVFADKEKQKDMSSIARERHDPERNMRSLIDTYHDIAGVK